MPSGTVFVKRSFLSLFYQALCDFRQDFRSISMNCLGWSRKTENTEWDGCTDPNYFFPSKPRAWGQRHFRFKKKEDRESHSSDREQSAAGVHGNTNRIVLCDSDGYIIVTWRPAAKPLRMQWGGASGGGKGGGGSWTLTVAARNSNKSMAEVTLLCMSIRRARVCSGRVN
jgi:hypothetical protein